jgi:hypothetical protein
VTRVLLPDCNRSWIVHVPPGCDGPSLRAALPSLLWRVEAEGVTAIHLASLRAMSPGLRAALEAAEVTAADAVDIGLAHDERPTAHLVQLPSHRR